MRFFSLKIRITWCEEERARVCAYAPYAHLYVHMYDNYGKIINNDNKCDAREWKSEMGRVHIMYLHARVMHGCTIRRLSFFFVSSPATSETTINAVILMHNEREKRKRTEIAKFRRASCSSIIILSLFFSLFLSFFLDATRNKTKFTRSYCIRLEKCYNFATFAVRTDSSFSDDTKKQKFAPFFYIHVCTYI